MKICDDVVVYPTDTVWGIGGSIFSEKAQREIATIKKGEYDKPLSVLFPNISTLNEYVRLPEIGNVNWSDFFCLESTLLLPKELFPTVPSWVIHNSPYVGLRVLDGVITQKIWTKILAPVTSTSLNLTGESPIVKESDAKAFHLENCPSALFIGEQGQKPSGESSTILKFENDSFSFLRKGRNADEIINVLGLSAT